MHITLCGEFRLQIIYAWLEGKKLCRRIITEQFVRAESKETVSNSIPKYKKGVVYFRLKAKKENSRFYGAVYEALSAKERDIVIALNICTYRREEYLLRNIKLLQQMFLKNESSALYGKLKVFITDNGSTLDIEQISDLNIHVVHNPNVGGAGGFTRGLLEIFKRIEVEHITNVIFMDDDVEIEPEAILRSYRMLCLLKEEYKNSFISGAMLRLDKKYVQHENGALWNAGKCKFVNRALDLRDFKNIVYNELEQPRDYAAWWYCCIPAHIIRADNLPLPLFIHQDDTEYSLRNADHIITMGGIAIWHEAGDNKRLSSNEYYNLRNMLFVNQIYCPQFGERELYQEVFKRMLKALLRYRYKDMYLIVQAVKDYRKGMGWLYQIDGAEYHREIQQKGYQLEDVSEYINICRPVEVITELKLESPFSPKEKRWTIIKILKLFGHAMTLNGWLIPCSNEMRTALMSVHPARLQYVKNLVLYDDESNKGIVVKRDIKEIINFMRLYFRVVCMR